MIFYFTGTGNSYYAARTFQAQLGGKLYSIPDLVKAGRFDFTAEPGEYIGFVFPVYFLGLPAVLHRFIPRLKIRGACEERTFILGTMGKTTGESCVQLKQMLAVNGIRAGYIFSVPMPDNSLFTMPSPEEANHAVDRADPELQYALACMRNGKPGDYNKHRGFLSAIGSPVIYRFYSRKTKPFHVTENCNSCGYCQSVCPVEAIALKDGKPRWVKEQCEFCLACYHRCPQAAIRHGSNWSLKGQYLNPRVTLPLPGSDHEAI